MTDETDPSETATMVRATRALLSSALGLDGDMSLVDFGHLLGYSGQNVFQTVKRLETGAANPGGTVLVRLAELAQAARYHQYGMVVVPEWSFMVPAEELDDDGSTLYLSRNWFPRMLFAATGQAQGALEDLGFEEVGVVSAANSAYSDDDMAVYVLYQDVLPKPGWYSRFLQTALDHLGAEMNRQAEEEHAR